MDYQQKSYDANLSNYNSGGLGGVQMGNAPTTAPTPPITAGEEISRLEQAIASLHQTCETLEKRLSPILAASPPEPGSESASGERIGLSPVTAQLRNLQRAVNAADSRLGRILNRLEL